MKKYSKYLMILAAGFLAACSSMEVDEDEIAQENYPSDFSLAEYIELHPALVSLQVQDSVKAHNAALEMDKAAITENLNAFYADTANLHKLFVDPALGGFTEDDWETTWEPTERTVQDTAIVKIDTIQVKFELEGTVTAVHFPSSIERDAEGAIIGAEGYSDAEKTTPLTCDLATCGTFVTKKGGIVADTTKDITEKVVLDEGGITKDLQTTLSKFNLNDLENDYEVLKSIQPDSVAISQQYIVYGKKAGWAYRKCKDSELDNPEIISVDEVKLGKTYCDDNGRVREIK